jgi:hypothetical protein
MLYVPGFAMKEIHMKTRPYSVSAVLALIAVNVLIWFVFDIIVAANVHPALPNSTLIKGIMAFLSFATAGILLILLVLLGRQNRLAYFLTLGLFVAISVLTIFDDFGMADLVVLVLNIAPATLLIKDRAWYLQAKPNAVASQ